VNASTRSRVSGQEGWRQSRNNYGKENTLIPDDKRDKLATLRAVAGRHGVDLVAAALQFSLAPAVASALIVGTANPTHILADHAALQAKIPPAFWDELRSTGMLHPDFAVTINKD